MNKPKTNKGITLVALVITIIVLIILAGVSINAVLNGGIITNAKDAKNQYNEGKVKEETALIDLEVQSDFETAVKGEQAYKFQNKFMTGIEPTTKVSDITLPNGYKLYKVDGSTITKEEESSIYVSTGMILKKNEKEIGRIIIFGDITCDGSVNGSDLSPYVNALNWDSNLSSRGRVEDYIKIAMDVNHDGIVSYDDEALVLKISLGQISKIEQNVAAPEPDGLIMHDKKAASELYIKDNLTEEFEQSGYSLEWNEEERTYFLKGANIGSVTAQDILSLLPESTKVQRGLGRNAVTLEQGNLVEKGDYIFITDAYYGLDSIEFATID